MITTMTKIFTERLVIRSLTRCDIDDVYDIFHELFLNILPTNDASLGVARNVWFSYVEEDEDDKDVQVTDLRPLDRYALHRTALVSAWAPGIHRMYVPSRKRIA